MDKLKIPIGLKIIAILYLSLGILGILAGITFMTWSQIGSFPEEWKEFYATVAISSGIVFLTLGLFGMLIGTGLWKRKKWAKLIAIVFSIVTLIQAIFNLSLTNFFLPLSLIIINIAIVSYLILSKGAKEAFSHQNR